MHDLDLGTIGNIIVLGGALGLMCAVYLVAVGAHALYRKLKARHLAQRLYGK